MKTKHPYLSMIFILLFVLLCSANCLAQDAGSPGRTKITYLKLAKKGGIRIRWKKAKHADAYRVECSTDKTFRKNVIREDFGTRTSAEHPFATSGTIAAHRNLYTGRTYYLRVGSCRYTGDQESWKWSKIRRIRIPGELQNQLSLNRKKVTVRVGGTFTLTGTFKNPHPDTNPWYMKSFPWQSSDKAVVSVQKKTLRAASSASASSDSKEITYGGLTICCDFLAKKPGTAAIKLTIGGVTKTCKVTIRK